MGSLSLLLVAVGLILSGFSSIVHGVGSAVGSDAVGVGCLVGVGSISSFHTFRNWGRWLWFSMMDARQNAWKLLLLPHPSKNLSNPIYFRHFRKITFPSFLV